MILDVRRATATSEPRSLDACIAEVAPPDRVLTEEDDPGVRRDHLALIARQHAEGLQLCGADRDVMALERIFEPRLVQVREHDSGPGEEIEGLPSSLAAKLGEHLRVSSPAGRPQTDIHALLRTLRPQMKRRRVMRHLDHQQLVLAVGRRVDLRKQLRLNPITDAARQTLLLTQRVRDTDDRSVVVNSDHDHPARRVGERHDVLQDRLPGGQITLEVHTWTLPLSYGIRDLHTGIFSASVTDRLSFLPFLTEPSV